MRKNCRFPKIILYQTLFRSLEPLLSGNEYFNSDDENTRMLENILVSVISLVVVLVIILFYITFKTRSTQNRFKLLDNSGNFQSAFNQSQLFPSLDGVNFPEVSLQLGCSEFFIADNISSYQSVSPADTLLPPVSPLASRRPSGDLSYLIFI